MNYKLNMLFVLITLFISCLVMGSAFATDINSDDTNIQLNNNVMNINEINEPQINNENENIDIDIEAVINNCTYGDPVVGHINTHGKNGTVIVQIYAGSSRPESYNVSENGNFTIKSILGANDYNNVAISFTSDDGEYKGSEIISFTISKANVTVFVENIKNLQYSTVNVTVNVTDTKGNPADGGIVTIQLNDENYTDFVKDGVAIIEVELPEEGNYIATAYFNDTCYNETSFTFNVTSEAPEEIDIEAVIYNCTYGSPIIGHINTHGHSGEVILQLFAGSSTPEFYKVSENGTFICNDKIFAGSFDKVVVSFTSDDGRYVGNEITNFTIYKDNVKVIVEDITGVEGSKAKVTVKVIANNVNPVDDEEVTIKINGKKYTTYTKNGIATVNIILPKEGIYSATAYYGGEYTGYNKNSTEFTVTSKAKDNPEPTPIPENDNKDNNNVSNIPNTGNPLLVLLISLAVIGLESIRRKF